MHYGSPKKKSQEEEERLFGKKKKMTEILTHLMRGMNLHILETQQTSR